MKKYSAFLLVVFLMLSFISNAQKGKELIIGVGGAVNSVWIANQNFYGEPEVDYAPKMGYLGSFNLGYDITSNMSVIAEFQYSRQGQKYEGKQSIDGNKYDVLRDINLNYFNIPVFFKYAFGDKETKFRFMVGPQFGFLLDATQTYTRDGKTLGTAVTDVDGKPFFTDATNIKDRFESNDIGFALDIGADIHLSKQFFINAGFRGNYGFKDINAAPYRLKDIDGNYTPSHNFWGGLYFGINYKIDVEGYNQRSF